MNSSTDTQYTDTVNLPQTNFPMKGNGPLREPEFQKIWEESKIYEEALELRKNSELFVLHDGPPYLSSDQIHIGTALNKILKDIIIKYKFQRGFRTPYIPGYDSHGLPIETAVVKEIKGGREAVSITELRDQCKNFALKNLKGQEEKFKRLGILGDWSSPYVTLDPQYEAEQIRLFGEMASKSYIYRGLRTVYWSYGAQTALADAEIEYNENHISDSIYVAFDIKNIEKFPQLIPQTKILIWTTTPWTIPANMAICLNENLDYVIVENDSTKFLVAKDLVEELNKQLKKDYKIVSRNIKGKDLDSLICKHPLYTREVPIVFGDHVSTDSGTGVVHTAPGHGSEDFEVGKKYNLEILCPVDGKGKYTNQAKPYKGPNKEIIFEGLKVFEEGNPKVIEALQDSGALIAHNKYQHSYPYCWRSKTPLIFRATEQWFCSVKAFRKEALKAIDNVNWIPERGKNRIRSMVEERGDWCISRQRTWGLPIPAFYNTGKLNAQGNPEAILQEEIIEHVARIFATQGSSAWYTKSIEDLIPQSFFEKNPEIKLKNLIKELDTMDVWFDSGSSHRAVIKAREELSPNKNFRKADLYLEGSDQHRGWFQSSLLTSVASNGDAPYKAVLTHGFVLDEKGRKMSKSLKNVVDPNDVIKIYGADILRLWVASVDYSIDIKVGDNLFKQLSDTYRNFRNTARYILGNLYDYQVEKNYTPYSKLWKIDQLILHRSQILLEKLTEAFEQYQFFKYYQLIQNFCSVELSAFYFDIIKDRLYTHPSNSESRRAAQSTIYELLQIINRVLVPILPHLAEDIYQHSPESIKASYAKSDFFPEGIKSQSILLSNWPSLKSQFFNLELEDSFVVLLELRDKIFKKIEELRQNKILGKSIEAKVYLESPEALFKLLKNYENELATIFIISELKLNKAEELRIEVNKFEEGHKCPRCWKYFKELLNSGLCQLCNDAI